MELLFALGFLAAASLAGMIVFYWKNRVLEVKLSENQYAVEKLKMEIEVMRSQLNPHFLNNLFNFLSYKTSVGNSVEVAESIHVIGSYLRSIHRISKRSTHSLEMELDWIEEYLNLYIMLSLGAISYDLNIDSKAEIETIEVPACIFSSVIDFFVVHRFHNGGRSGKLEISVTNLNQEIVIRFVDNIDLNFSEHDSLVKQMRNFLIRRMDLFLLRQNQEKFFKIESDNGIEIRFPRNYHV